MSFGFRVSSSNHKVHKVLHKGHKGEVLKTFRPGGSMIAAPSLVLIPEGLHVCRKFIIIKMYDPGWGRILNSNICFYRHLTPAGVISLECGYPS